MRYIVILYSIAYSVFDISDLFTYRGVLKNHYPALVTYRDAALPIKIKAKAKFEEHNMMERVKSSCFKKFFIVPTFKISGQLLHQILRKIVPKGDDEMQFQIRSYILVRFGMV